MHNILSLYFPYIACAFAFGLTCYISGLIGYVIIAKKRKRGVGGG